MAQLKKTPINDFYAKGAIRADGRMVHDMYLAEVKKPSESKEPWDLLKVVKKVPGEQVFTTKAESQVRRSGSNCRPRAPVAAALRQDAPLRFPSMNISLPALLSQLLLGLVNGSFYAILSLGLAVIFGLLNVINFAHGALFMMGAVLAWMAMNYFGINYWVMLVAGAARSSALLRRA